MPELFIKTNVPKSQISKTILTELTTLLADTLGKPTKYIAVVIQPDMWMSFAGTEDPCATCLLTSIGSFNTEDNVKFAAVFMKFLYEKLGIDDERMYFEFHGPTKDNMGFKGTTFHEILNAKK